MKAVEVDHLSIETPGLRGAEPMLVTQRTAPMGLLYPIKA